MRLDAYENPVDGLSYAMLLVSWIILRDMVGGLQHWEPSFTQHRRNEQQPSGSVWERLKNKRS